MTESNEFRLPSAVAPRTYRLALEPDLESLTFKGEVAIDLDVKNPTREIVLHAANLDVASARLGGETLELRPEPARDRLALVAAKPLAAGLATVTLAFSGKLSEEMRGFYRSSYTRPDGSKGVLATTQFEATSARRCFPCFDEPALKAVFEVTMIVPKGLQGVSNMPPASEEALGDGRRRVRFAPSPVMSTYLLAFAVGEFDSIDGKTEDGMPVRVFTTPGRAELGRFALETAIRGLKFFGDYYGIPYRKALPKLDLLAIPDFEYGAMENWGAITFRETAIFVDPKRSSIPQRRRVAEVVLHELAHQWFGNLVTPEWWSYLWLNESFATFMAYKASNALFPEWNIFEEYLAQITSAGKSLDSLRSSHPVEVIVRDPNEVDQIFDAISYNKGGSVLRMLERSVGEDAFRRGIRRFLESRAYACATTDDLWSALGEATGADVGSMMNGWTRTTGLPALLVERQCGRLRLRQERFLLDRDPAKPAEDPALWEIPLPTVDGAGRSSVLRLSGRETTVDAPAADWIKVNAGQAGFYLTHYDDAGWRALAKAVEALALGAMDRYGLQEDAYSLMRAGYLSVPGYLRLAGAFSREENHYVWAGVADGIAALTEIFTGDPDVPRLEEWGRKLVMPTLQKVGCDEKAEDPNERLLLRATLMGAALRFGDPEAVEQVRTRFEAARKNLSALPPNTRSVILSGAARNGDAAVFDALTELHEKADLPEVKVQLLRALGAFRLEPLLRRAVAYALSDKVRRQDAMAVFGSIPIEMKPVGWKLLQEHWPVLDERYGKSGLIGHFIAAAAGGIPSEEHAAQVERFFKEHPVPYASEKIKQTLEGIRARAGFRARNRRGLADFFAAPGP
ncbi:MAG: M1 family metallopeptidase [Planctomycetes bacterium]|nr:M1 family metallopeptidase [Planctomycetota bacterium]